MEYLFSWSSPHVFNSRLPLPPIHRTSVKVPPRKCGDSVKNEGGTEKNYPKTQSEVLCAVIVCCIWCWPAWVYQCPLLGGLWSSYSLWAIQHFLSIWAKKLWTMVIIICYLSIDLDRKRQKHSLPLNSVHESGTKYCSFYLILRKAQPFSSRVRISDTVAK